MVVAVRGSGLAPELREAIDAAVHDVDPALPIASYKTQLEQIDETIGKERVFTRLLTAFGGFALLLACVGLHGVTSHSVARRTPEIGVRLALGAQRLQVRWLVLAAGDRARCGRTGGYRTADRLVCRPGHEQFPLRPRRARSDDDWHGGGHHGAGRAWRGLLARTPRGAAGCADGLEIRVTIRHIHVFCRDHARTRISHSEVRDVPAAAVAMSRQLTGRAAGFSRPSAGGPLTTSAKATVVGRSLARRPKPAPPSCS